MSFELEWSPEAQSQYESIKFAAQMAFATRAAAKRTKSSKQEGLFKQVRKCLQMLSTNPRHPGLHTHDYDSLEHPYDPKQKAFEAYVQNKTPSAYRVFWCYGPKQKQITVIAITSHP